MPLNDFLEQMQWQKLSVLLCKRVVAKMFFCKMGNNTGEFLLCVDSQSWRKTTLGSIHLLETTPQCVKRARREILVKCLLSGLCRHFVTSPWLLDNGLKPIKCDSNPRKITMFY